MLTVPRHVTRGMGLGEGQNRYILSSADWASCVGQQRALAASEACARRAPRSLRHPGRLERVLRRAGRKRHVLAIASVCDVGRENGRGEGVGGFVGKSHGIMWRADDSWRDERLISHHPPVRPGPTIPIFALLCFGQRREPREIGLAAARHFMVHCQRGQSVARRDDHVGALLALTNESPRRSRSGSAPRRSLLPSAPSAATLPT